MSSSAVLSDMKTATRVIELLAQGENAHSIAGTLRKEGIAEVHQRTVHNYIRAIINDPFLSRQLYMEQQAVRIAKTAELAGIADSWLDKINKLLERVYARAMEVEHGGDLKTLVALEKCINMLQPWWTNVAKIHKAVDDAKVNVNLTQINIGEVTAVNGQLLSIIQDMMRHLPADKQRLVRDRLEDIETNEPIDAEFTEGSK